MDSNKAKTILSSLQAKKRVVVLSGLFLMIVLLAGLTVRVMSNTAQKMSPGRVERVVSGTDWKYSVDMELETKFGIFVTLNKPTSELKFKGRGCNHITAYVIESEDSDLDARELHGKRYQLKAGESTLVACVGEGATNDEKLSAEFEKMFESLQ